jgi:hypothetical protein
MNAKTIGGLIGAHGSANMMNTPMRIYREARSKGDTTVMGRAAGYAGDYAQNANENLKKAAEGIKEEAAEARVKLERGQSIENRKGYQGNPEVNIEEVITAQSDTIVLSEDGKALLKYLARQNTDNPEQKVSTGETPVIYTKTGEIGPAAQGTVLRNEV